MKNRQNRKTFTKRYVFVFNLIDFKKILKNEDNTNNLKAIIILRMKNRKKYHTKLTF